MVILKVADLRAQKIYLDFLFLSLVKLFCSRISASLELLQRVVHKKSYKSVSEMFGSIFKGNFDSVAFSPLWTDFKTILHYN